jgi:Fe-Mn family superoxide dismutase
MFTRREALRVFGGGVALVGLGALGATARAAEPPDPSGTPQPFVLPALGYGFDALEPHIDERTMEIHYTKHHQAYIANANKVLSEHPELAQLTAEAILRNLDAIPAPIRTALRNNVGGHVNHSFYWKIIAPGGGDGPTGPLADAINGGFGSLADFQKKFTEAAMKRFGSGWAWLSSKNGQLSIASMANQDSPLSDGAVPVIGLDVWEHAYYLKHQNRRAEYVESFWDVVNWAQAGDNFAAIA